MNDCVTGRDDLIILAGEVTLQNPLNVRFGIKRISGSIFEATIIALDSNVDVIPV
jgi:hypothetical protein